MDSDIAALRSVASDYDAAGAQFATLAALLRRAATRLEQCHAPPVPVPADTAPRFMLDDDGIPAIGRTCVNCEI